MQRRTTPSVNFPPVFVLLPSTLDISSNNPSETFSKIWSELMLNSTHGDPAYISRQILPGLISQSTGTFATNTSTQPTTAFHAMPSSISESEDATEDSTMLCEADGKDPILRMKEAMTNEARRKVKCAELWDMVSYLHDQLNGVLAVNADLKKDVALLKTKNVELHQSSDFLTKKILDVQDELRVYKQTNAVEIQESIKRLQSMPPSDVNNRNRASTNANFPPFQKTTSVASAASVSPPAQEQSSAPAHRPTSTDEIRTAEHQQDTTRGADSASNGKRSTWTEVVRRKSVRGSQPVAQANEPSPPQGLMATLSIKHQPHLDFKVRGIPRRDPTVHDTPVAYNSRIQADLENEGFKIRFVSVYEPEKEDRRGTTFMRIGTYRSEEERMMNPDNWPVHCAIETWQYRTPAQSNNQQQQSNGQKNRQ